MIDVAGAGRLAPRTARQLRARNDLLMDARVTRSLWRRLEALNAVAYFSPECREAPAEIGLKGFWMGYFACRAAPMGPVGAGVVEATFANFHPDRVKRAIPDAWSLAEPAGVLTVRWSAAAAALRRLIGATKVETLSESACPLLEQAITSGSPLGRPLFAANAQLSPPADPVARLWQAATTLREHRGDGHVALLASAGLDGCEAHVLQAGVHGTPADLYLQSRGWSSDDWQAAIDRLATRGLVDSNGWATEAGRSELDHIEARTDELALDAYRFLGDDAVDGLVDLLTEPARRVTASGELLFPNPMGLPESD